MKRPNHLRVQYLRQIRREIDVAQELEVLGRKLDADAVNRTIRRSAYAERISPHLPLTTEELMVAISEVASLIADTSPPSVTTVRRWLFLYLVTPCESREKIFSKVTNTKKANTFLYEE